MGKVKQAVEILVSPKDKYSEFISVMRNIRNSYKITQNEMALLLSAVQSTITKFELVDLGTKLEDLISYAFVLGYSIEVAKLPEPESEISRFDERQSKISNELHHILPHYIQNSFNTVSPRDILGALEENIALIKKNVRDELVYAKHILNGDRLTALQVCIGYSNEYQKDLSYLFPDDSMEEITTNRLAQKLNVSERTVRRFENDEDFASSSKFVFKYADIVSMDLRLKPIFQTPRESLGDFYIRNCLALHDTIKKCVRRKHQV
jgi:transcriptional regulator with XRE-family HTH domain